jgi:hypothetical protein
MIKIFYVLEELLKDEGETLWFEGFFALEVLFFCAVFDG